MRFTKMHGAGNDFIVINNMDGAVAVEELGALALRLCAAHTGVGADGLMVAMPASSDADYAMLYFNSDGSEGEMCGNGARCMARYGYEKGLAGEKQRIETASGVVLGERIDKGRYSVRLNDPSYIELKLSLEINDRSYDCSYVELGVPGLPHLVVPMQYFDLMDGGELKALGRTMRNDPRFAKGANVTFVKRLGDNCLKAVTYERGVEDFTLACGTGCGSVAAALSLSGDVDCCRELKISMPGGELAIKLCREGDCVRDIWLTGPAVIVYEAELVEG